MKNFGDYTYFVYLGNNKRYGFQTYKDPVTGQTIGYVIGKDDKGHPIYKRWSFNFDSQRQIRVGKEEKDLNGRLAVDFLRNSPECYGSPNGYIDNGVQVFAYFKEVNAAKDAEVALESRTVSIKAQSHALNLKGQALIDLAAVIGIFHNDEEVLRMKVLDYASNFPKKYLELIDDPSQKVKALLQKALNAGVFNKDGRQIKWENKLIGADEDEAISTLMKDEKLKKAIETNLAKFGG